MASPISPGCTRNSHGWARGPGVVPRLEGRRQPASGRERNGAGIRVEPSARDLGDRAGTEPAGELGQRPLPVGGGGTGQQDLLAEQHDVHHDALVPVVRDRDWVDLGRARSGSAAAGSPAPRPAQPTAGAPRPASRPHRRGAASGSTAGQPRPDSAPIARPRSAGTAPRSRPAPTARRHRPSAGRRTGWARSARRDRVAGQRSGAPGFPLSRCRRTIHNHQRDQTSGPGAHTSTPPIPDPTYAAAATPVRADVSQVGRVGPAPGAAAEASATAFGWPAGRPKVSEVAVRLPV
jgi:hypothetical protein